MPSWSLPPAIRSAAAGVLGHVERVLVAHVDNRRADLDAAGFRSDRSQQRKRRSQLARKMMDAKIGAVRAELLRGDGELNGLQQRVRGRARLRLRGGRPVTEGDENPIFFMRWVRLPGRSLKRIANYSHSVRCHRIPNGARRTDLQAHLIAAQQVDCIGRKSLLRKFPFPEQCS